MADSEFWRTKIKGNIDRDKRNLLQLIQNGWQPLIIWECELKNMEFVKSRILDFLGPPSFSNN